MLPTISYFKFFSSVNSINAWYAPSVSRAKSNKLIDEGADVLAHHVDTPTPVKVAQERGVYAFGYHSDMSEFGPKSHLASVVHDWGKIYEKRIAALTDDTWSSQDLWSGLKQSTSKLVSINPLIPQWVMDKVEIAKTEIMEGKRQIFTGPIKNHRGRVRLKEGRQLSDVDLQRMNWYVQGIEGKLKFF